MLIGREIWGSLSSDVEDSSFQGYYTVLIGKYVPVDIYRSTGRNISEDLNHSKR
jgi:hypothetical protein